MVLKRYVLLTALCFVPTSLFSNKLYFPQVPFGGGYTTTVLLMNTGTTSVSSNLQIYAQTGVLLRSIPTTVSSGGSTRLTIADPGQSIISSWGMLDAGTGTVQGLATFDLRSANDALITTAGVSGLEATNGFRLPVDVTGSGNVVNTAIALVNVNPSNPVTVALVLRPESGSISSFATSVTRFITLDSGHQLPALVTNVWPHLAVGFRGTLSIVVVNSAQQPNSLVLTALSVKGGLLSALPVIPDSSLWTLDNNDREPSDSGGTHDSCSGCWDY